VDLVFPNIRNSTFVQSEQQVMQTTQIGFPALALDAASLKPHVSISIAHLA
jgi:hypothetical protein